MFVVDSFRLRRASGCGLALCASIAAFSFAPPAEAHGGIPRAYSVLFQPGGDQIILRSDVWGFYLSTDGGGSFSWVCAESYGGRSLSAGEKRSFVIMPGGDIFVANVFSGLRVARGGDVCNFEEIPLFEPEVVQDVVLSAEDGSRLNVLTATGKDGGIDGYVWESTDGGMNFTQLGTQLPATFSGTSVAVAPSDPTRIYVAGKSLDATDDGTVLRSSDNGASWESFTVPVGKPDWVSRIAAVHPMNPDEIYFWMDTNEGSGGDIQPDEIWLSTDGAETWTQIYQGTGNLPGFALSPDLSTVAIGGPQDGLLMAQTAELPTAGSAAFTQVFSGKIFGLHWNEEALFAGNDDFTPGDEPKFTYGMSMDQGASFMPLLEICDTPLVECPADSITARACEPKLTDPGGYEVDYLNGPRCNPDAATGGTTGAGGSSPTGTGAVTGSGAVPGSGGGGAAAGAAPGAGGSGGPAGAAGAGAGDPIVMGSGGGDGGGCSVATGQRRLSLFGLSAFALSLLAQGWRRRTRRARR